MLIRPKLLILAPTLTLFFLLLPMFWIGGGFHHISIIVLLLGLLHALAIYHGSPTVFVTGPFLIIASAWDFWIKLQGDFFPQAFFGLLFFSLTITLCLIFLNHPESRLFIQPSLRWWRTSPRKSTSIDAELRPVSGSDSLQAKLANLSETGAFVSLEESHWISGKHTFRELKIGTLCIVKLRISSTCIINLDAVVVRFSRASTQTQRPLGLGLQFVYYDRENKKSLVSYLKSEVQFPLDS